RRDGPRSFAPAALAWRGRSAARSSYGSGPVQRAGQSSWQTPDLSRALRRLRESGPGGRAAWFCRLQFHIEQPRHPSQPFCSRTGELTAGTQDLAQCRKRLPAQALVGGQHVRDGGKRRLLVEQQHEILLAQEDLELLERRAGQIVLSRAQAAH